MRAHPWFESLPAAYTAVHGPLDWARLAAGQQASPLLARLAPHLDEQRAAGPELAEQLVQQLDVAEAAAAPDVEDRSVV